MAEDTAPLLRLTGSALLHGAYRWCEERLYERTGAWSAAPGLDGALAVHLFEMSARHAWHAELWAARLPVLAGVDADVLTRPYGPAVGPVFDALEVPPPDPTGFDSGVPEGGSAGSDRSGGPLGLSFMVGLYRVVLPRLLVTYRQHLAMATAVSHGPTLRALHLVVHDEAEQLAAGEALVQGMLSEVRDAARAAEAQRALESLVVEAGIGMGLVPWSGTELEGVGLRSIQPS